MIDLADLLHLDGAHLIQAGAEKFSGMATSSGNIVDGCLFFAIRGESRDGHEFVDRARVSGAAGVVVDRPISVEAPCTVVLVPDTLIALQELARIVKDRYDPKTIAITGSAGKTTTKDMVAMVLRSKFAVNASLASHNNHLGVPVTLLNLQPTDRYLVSEIGTNHPGEIATLGRLVGPDIALVLNVGYAHLGNFGTEDALLAEKVSLFDAVKPHGVCIYNGDDRRLRPLAERQVQLGRSAVSVGFSQGNDIRAQDVRFSDTGSQAVVTAHGDSQPIQLAAWGRPFLYAALFAIAVGLECGLALDESIAPLARFETSRGRSSVSSLSGEVILIDDSHNSSPDAALAAAELISQMPGEMKIAVVSEMGELGGSSQHLHTKVGSALGLVATHVIAVGDGARPILEAARASSGGSCIVSSCDSAFNALNRTRELLLQDERPAVVLVKGSRFRHMERVAIGLRNFSAECRMDICHLYINCADCAQLGVAGFGPEQEEAARAAQHARVS